MGLKTEYRYVRPSTLNEFSSEQVRVEGSSEHGAEYVSSTKCEGFID